MLSEPTDLTVDILHVVFGHLPLPQYAHTLSACSLVCKTWLPVARDYLFAYLHVGLAQPEDGVMLAEQSSELGRVERAHQAQVRCWRGNIAMPKFHTRCCSGRPQYIFVSSLAMHRHRLSRRSSAAALRESRSSSARTKVSLYIPDRYRACSLSYRRCVSAMLL